MQFYEEMYFIILFAILYLLEILLMYVSAEILFSDAEGEYYICIVIWACVCICSMICPVHSSHSQ